MNALYGFIGAMFYLWAFWGLYVLVMGIYRAHLDRRLNPATKLLGFPFVVIGAFIDVVANMTIATLVFLEPPSEWLVTQRLQRHMKDGGGWRYRLSCWVCMNLLDVFDPTGKHC